MNTMQEFQIEVFNAYGQQQEVSFSENTPDFSELPKGVYTIRFRQGDDTYMEDFVKQ
jgi:hypothetical protein